MAVKDDWTLIQTAVQVAFPLAIEKAYVDGNIHSMDENFPNEIRSKKPPTEQNWEKVWLRFLIDHQNYKHYKPRSENLDTLKESFFNSMSLFVREAVEPVHSHTRITTARKYHSSARSLSAIRCIVATLGVFGYFGDITDFDLSYRTEFGVYDAADSIVHERFWRDTMLTFDAEVRDVSNYEIMKWPVNDIQAFVNGIMDGVAKRLRVERLLAAMRHELHELLYRLK